jgi:hypothetical protein
LFVSYVVGTSTATLPRLAAAQYHSARGVWRKKALRLRRPSLCLRTMRVRERVTVWPEGEAHVPACVGARLYLFGDGLEVEVLDPPDLELAATPLFLAPQVPLEIRLRTEHRTD